MTMTREEVKAEHQRRKSNRDKLLGFLIDNGEVTNVELEKVAGYRFSARLHELRRKGHIIVTKKASRGLCHYIYLGNTDSE